MIHVRKSHDRGRSKTDWLDSYHSFSFADYYDRDFMGFRSLRVINEDWIKPGTGFGMHPHQDMEILTYVVEGAIEHQDSMGNRGQIRSGELQKMSAGTGVLHSEVNPSPSESLHLFQIWIQPKEQGIDPGYEQRQVYLPEDRGRLRLIAGARGGDDALRIHQDVHLYAAQLRDGERVDHQVDTGRHIWIQLAKGSIEVNGVRMNAGDGAGISENSILSIESRGNAELLLFDLV